MQLSKSARHPRNVRYIIREWSFFFWSLATLLGIECAVLKILTYYENGDQFHGHRRWLAVADERLHRVLGEAETDDGHLRRLQHQGGHPREQERRQRAEGVHEVGVLGAGTRVHRAQLCVRKSTWKKNTNPTIKSFFF